MDEVSLSANLGSFWCRGWLYQSWYVWPLNSLHSFGIVFCAADMRHCVFRPVDANRCSFICASDADRGVFRAADANQCGFAGADVNRCGFAGAAGRHAPVGIHALLARRARHRIGTIHQDQNLALTGLFCP